MFDFIYHDGLVFGLLVATFLGILYMLLLVLIYKIRTKRIRAQQQKALEKWRRGHESIGYLIDVDPDK